jgi:hypothetical protein
MRGKVRTLKVIPGTKYGRLTVIREIDPQIGSDGSKKRHVKCLCECSSYCTPLLINLISGNTRSCGCLRDEVASERASKGIRSKNTLV